MEFDNLPPLCLLPGTLLPETVEELEDIILPLVIGDGVGVVIPEDAPRLKPGGAVDTDGARGTLIPPIEEVDSAFPVRSGAGGASVTDFDEDTPPTLHGGRVDATLAWMGEDTPLLAGSLAHLCGPNPLLSGLYAPDHMEPPASSQNAWPSWLPHWPR
jgi:hypothetical protein